MHTHRHTHENRTDVLKQLTQSENYDFNVLYVGILLTFVFYAN